MQLERCIHLWNTIVAQGLVFRTQFSRHSVDPFQMIPVLLKRLLKTLTFFILIHRCFNVHVHVLVTLIHLFFKIFNMIPFSFNFNWFIHKLAILNHCLSILGMSKIFLKFQIKLSLLPYKFLLLISNFIESLFFLNLSLWYIWFHSWTDILLWYIWFHSWTHILLLWFDNAFRLNKRLDGWRLMCF